MISKRILIVHRQAAVRDTYLAALADAGHHTAGFDPSSEGSLVDAAAASDLVIIDAGLAGDDLAALTEARLRAPRSTVVVFGSTVTGAAQVRQLAAAGIHAFVNDFSTPQQIVATLAPYLFHDNFNRRASPRVAVAMGVSCAANGIVSSATALNIGRTGIALRTLVPIPVGTAMALRFRLPAVTHDIEVDARVCWTDTQLGLGAQFERVSAHDQAALDAYVDGRLGEGP
jgi:CheY-like chemotaxis protein